MEVVVRCAASVVRSGLFVGGQVLVFSGKLKKELWQNSEGDS